MKQNHTIRTSSYEQREDGSDLTCGSLFYTEMCGCRCNRTLKPHRTEYLYFKWGLQLCDVIHLLSKRTSNAWFFVKYPVLF